MAFRVPLPAWLTAFLVVGGSLDAAPVEPGHPVHAFLGRLHIQGRLERAFLHSLPLQDAEVLRLLVSATRDSGSLARHEKADLRRHLRAFDPSLRRLESPLHYRDSLRTLSGGGDFAADAFLADSVPHAQGFAATALSLRAEGSFGTHLDFVSEATVAGEWARRPAYILNYDPARGLPYNTRKGRVDASERDERRTFDAFRTVVGLGAGTYRIEVGNDWNQWGPGIWQHPSLGSRPWFWVQDSLPPGDSAGFPGSLAPGAYRRGYRRPGEGPTMPQVRIAFTWPFLKYTKVLADKQGLFSREDAAVVAHRLDVRIGNLDLGAYEMVAYSDRAFEPVYAIPLVPLKIAEHFLGDRDNIALGIDASYAFRGRSRIYTELFLDDLLGPQDLFDDYWGNKFAWTVGGEILDPFLPASSLQVEYSRVEPWLFGHHVRDNQLQHFGSLLGSSLPPNSHAFRLRWNQRLTDALELAAEYGFLQRGVRARGSSIFDVHDRAVEGDSKEFLGDDPETRHAFQADLTARLGRRADVHIQAGQLLVDDWRSTPGQDLATPFLGLSASFRY